MKRVVFISVLLASAAIAAEVWTNRAGMAFSAKLLSVDEAGARFVFADDGATNVLSLAKLSPESARMACEQVDFVPIPPRLAATYNRAVSDLKRISELREDGLLSAEKAEARIDAVCSAFGDVCRKKGENPVAVQRLKDRLKSEMLN